MHNTDRPIRYFGRCRKHPPSRIRHALDPPIRVSSPQVIVCKLYQSVATETRLVAGVYDGNRQSFEPKHRIDVLANVTSR